MTLEIIVCTKQVPDPEGPPSSYEIDEEGIQVKARGISPVINPFDENALEVAIRLKESYGARITMISLGRSLSRAVFLKALATGADRMVLVEDQAFDSFHLDSYVTATLLAATINKLEGYHIILTGRQASDTNSGQVGLLLSGILRISAISLAQKVEVAGEKVLVERVLNDGYELVEAKLPILVTVSGEAGNLRYPSIQSIKAAKSLPRTEMKLADIGIYFPLKELVKTVSLTKPSMDRPCSFIDGDNPEEMGRKLAERLMSDKVI